MGLKDHKNRTAINHRKSGICDQDHLNRSDSSNGGSVASRTMKLMENTSRPDQVVPSLPISLNVRFIV